MQLVEQVMILMYSTGEFLFGHYQAQATVGNLLTENRFISMEIRFFFY